MNLKTASQYSIRIGGAATAFAVIAGPSIAEAYTSYVTVGTSFTRTPNELLCDSYNNCTNQWNHHKQNNCEVSTSARIRQQRDFQPDLTRREDSNFTGCSARGWKFEQESGNRHHQDGRVASGTGRILFTVQ